MTAKLGKGWRAAKESEGESQHCLHIHLEVKSKVRVAGC